MTEDRRPFTGTYDQACDAARQSFEATGRRSSVVSGAYYWFLVDSRGETDRNRISQRSDTPERNPFGPNHPRPGTPTMSPSQFKNLKHGDRVRHTDGVIGQLEKAENYTDLFEIVWADGQRMLLRLDSRTDAQWAETDIELVTSNPGA